MLLLKGKGGRNKLLKHWSYEVETSLRFYYSWLILVSLPFLTQSCVNTVEPGVRTKIYYLFDISGSYREDMDNGSTPLHESVKRAKEILKVLAELQDPREFPQAHQIGFISERIRHGKPATLIKQVGIFDKPGQDIRSFASELNSVLQTKPAGFTDIYGGLYNAVQALKGTNSGNNVIIMFSDLHVSSDNPSNYIIDMSGIKVLGYYIETGKARADPRILQKDISKFEEILSSSNCSEWRLLHLSSFDRSQIGEILQGGNENL